MATLPQRPSIPAGPSRHVYDVIVLGGQLGGAVAAALLAKKGYRILHVDHDGTGQGYEHEGYLLPFAPFITSPLKLMPMVEETLSELGLNTTIQRSIRAHSPDLQVIMPGHRVDFHQDAGKRLAELRREFGADAEAIETVFSAAAMQYEHSDAFLRDLRLISADGMLDAWKLKNEIKKSPALTAPPATNSDQPVVKLLRGLLPFVTYVSDPPNPLPAARTLSRVLRAPNRYLGGREGLRELLTKKLLDLGGHYVASDSPDSYIVEEFSFDGNKLVGIKVLRSENIYRASCFVLGTDAPAARRLIVDKKKHWELAQYLEHSATREMMFCVNWVVRPEALPQGMGELILLADGKGEGSLLVQQQPARRPAGRSEDQTRVVCAATFVSAKSRELGEAHLRALAAKISQRLLAIMPFVERGRVLVSIPALDAGGLRGSRLLSHPLYHFENAGPLGVAGLGSRTPVKNLFLASREVLPGLGLEGEFLAGIRASQLVQEGLKKRDPLRR